MQGAARTGEPRKITAAEAAALIRSGDWLDYGVTLCQPDTFDCALAERRDELRGVQIRSCITMKPRAVLTADPEGGHFHWFSWHFSGYDRRQHDAETDEGDFHVLTFPFVVNLSNHECRANSSFDRLRTNGEGANAPSTSPHASR